jgi:hypothetical protein
MGQVTIYLPEAVLARVRRRAEKAGKSVSAYIAELVEPARESGRFPKGFAALYGSWEGNLDAPDDPPPDEPGALR